MSLPKLKIKYTKQKKLNLQIDNFKGGVNTLLSAPRIKKTQAVEARNLMLVEDGMWTKRWGTDYFGTDAGGSVVDGFIEYRKSNGDRELIIFVNGLARKSTDKGVTWSTISGYTPTAGTPVQALQIGDYMYACNGTDSLARYNGTSFATYSALTTPQNLVATRATLSAGDYDYYYVVTAHNEVGETLGSTEAIEDVDEERNSWSGDDAIDLTWDAVSNATLYTIYLGETSGYHYKIGESTTNSFGDDGTNSMNKLLIPPDANTTEGPKFKYICVSGNRLWGCGDPDHPWTVHFSGLGDNVGIFSYAYQGGWINLEKGSMATTKGIIDFQGKPAVFCPTPDGKGTIWQIDITYDSTYEYYQPVATKITNQVSSLAPRGIVQVENDVFFITKNGVFILGNEPNITSTVLRTSELSANIRDYIQSISDDDMNKICAYYKDGKVFFATPNQMFYYDRERLCWVKHWTIGASQLGEHTDSDGIVHYIGGMSSDGYLIKFTENYQGDSGVAFDTKYLSGKLPVSKKWTDYAKIKKCFINLGQPEGTVVFEILGTTRNLGFASQVSGTITPIYSMAGLGYDKLGTTQLGDSEGTPSRFQQDSLQRHLVLNERMRDIQFEVSTTELNAKYTLLGLRAEGTEISVRPSSDERLT